MPGDTGGEMEQAVPLIEKYKADPKIETLSRIVEESGDNPEAIKKFFDDYVEYQKQLATETGGKLSEDIKAFILENPEEAAKLNIRRVLSDIGSSRDGKMNDRQKGIIQSWEEAVPGL